MRYIKLAFHIILYKPWFNLLIILEVTAMLILTNAVIAAYNSRQMLYAPYRDILAEQGVVLMLENKEMLEIADDDDIRAITDRHNGNLDYDELFDLIRSHLKGDHVQIRCTKRLGLDSAALHSVMAGSNAYSVFCYCIDHDVFEKLRMPLSAGRWASSEKTTDGAVEVVISGGTDAELNRVYDTPEGKIKVVGILTDSTYIPPGNFRNIIEKRNMNIFDYYEVFDRNVSQRAPFAIADGNILGRSDNALMESILFITYGHSVSEEDCKANNQFLKRFGVIRSMNGDDSEENFQTVAQASEKALQDIYTKMLPIILAAVVVVLAGLIGSVSIATVRQRKNFGIFFLCGCRHKDCTNIILAYLSLLFTASVLLTVAGIGIMKLMNMNYIMGTVYGWNNLLISIAEIIIMYLLAMMLPYHIIRSSSPVTAIKGM